MEDREYTIEECLKICGVDNGWAADQLEEYIESLRTIKSEAIELFVAHAPIKGVNPEKMREFAPIYYKYPNIAKVVKEEGK